MTAIEDRTDTTDLRSSTTSRAPVIEISNVWKLHKLGDEVVKALVAADLTGDARRIRLPDGPERQRQVDAAEHDRRARPADQGHRQGRRHATRRP